ncbi:MAG TPA: apolipoprotein N-acyltransferase [Casimicrobiaceae bacterium]|nr:apolipoprotein N-acyltransferase [Casimicrobiaceae bacterium]
MSGDAPPVELRSLEAGSSAGAKAQPTPGMNAFTAPRAQAWGGHALALAAGACTVFSFAPYAVSGLVLVSLTLLLWLWQRAETARHAAWLGFWFGAGLFGAGASWLYIAIEMFGGMPPWLAFISIAVLVAYLSLWPAAAGFLAARFAPPGSIARLAIAVGAFTATEWIRSYLFTGFPWLALGYSQAPDGLLAGYAQVGGVYLVTLAIVLAAALVAYAIDGLARNARSAIALAIVGFVLLAVTGAAITRVEWTRPAGAALDVSLVQGNVLQDVKFDQQFRTNTFDRYLRLVEESRGRLVVLPESAFPMFSDEIPDAVLLSLIRMASARNGDVLLGLFTAEPPEPGGNEPRYYNTVIALGDSDLQFYRKNHLVPFGETIPLKPLIGWLIRSVLQIPLADQARGGATQPALNVAGQPVAVNICYEDAFGAELIHGARDAHILVNVTNDAWYGRSIAAEQHNQIAAMRALELGRPMLRATNTGITSAIGHDGREIARLPWFMTGVLEVSIVGREGATPYLRFGDAPVLILSALLIGAAFATGRRRTLRWRTGESR